MQPCSINERKLSRFQTTDAVRRDFRAVPEKYRNLVPEYVKDYVSLNQFAA